MNEVRPKDLVSRLRAVSTTEIETMYNLTREAADYIEHMRKEHAKEMRDFEREARETVQDAVAEERWHSRQGEDYGSW